MYEYILFLNSETRLQNGDKRLTDVQVLVLYLVHAWLGLRKHGVEGNHAWGSFGSYIASLPEEPPDLPMSWSPEKQGLSKTIAQHAVALQIEMQESLIFFTDGALISDDLEEMNLFKDAWAHVTSRSFCGGIAGKARCQRVKTESSAIEMIPVLDLVNHQQSISGNGPSVSFRAHQNFGEYFALRTIEPGEQVTRNFWENTTGTNGGFVISAEDLLLYGLA